MLSQRFEKTRTNPLIPFGIIRYEIGADASSERGSGRWVGIFFFWKRKRMGGAGERGWQEGVDPVKRKKIVAIK